ncbi:hypothetical protein BDU57DRAFT_595763 [Ampelomyces quisqualis]|uniref:SET domain-containing protein n=1 Tax=Ampelomyces quisqualis TaxID=50730 RepID=A0A6A5QHW2_AMPQU|nr:hypothetical protein BDU57DRAFT_595763 [Ampelomyces quisqualis]
MPVTAMVVIPTNGYTKQRVLVDKVHSIISNRVLGEEEQYLVRWQTDYTTNTPPLSWHAIGELMRCLDVVQDYLEARAKSIQSAPLSRKRKSIDIAGGLERRPSPFGRRLQQGGKHDSSSRSSSVSSAAPASVNIYNGVLDVDDDHFTFCRPMNPKERHVASNEPTKVAYFDISNILTAEMRIAAQEASVEKALRYIRNEYVGRLNKLKGTPIHLFNTVDSSTPSLRFKYIYEYVLREGVYRASKETQQGCTQCSPHMGRNIGCEYTKKCDCLEYAPVDESRIPRDSEQWAEYQNYKKTGGSTIGFPKKFPYFAEGVKRERAGCLVPFYLHSRHPIYECNDKCGCGPACRNKQVQFGRTVEVEIFKTASDRGWGLRCKQDLHEGQFIDTYRGEIITDAEATRRESVSSKAKGSYLYELDKFAETEGLEDTDVYVVDGEFMGGPTKFINHCCEPNCRQFTVSYNKHDCRVYDIAFFALRFIPAGQELTFDYLDKEEVDADDQYVHGPAADALPCLCGAEKCRKWLWT